MFGPETFIERVGDDALAPDLPEGHYAWIDPDEPARDGRLVAVWADGPGSPTLVRRLVVEHGRRVLRAANPDWPDIAVTYENETMIRGTVVFAGSGV